MEIVPLDPDSAGEAEFRGFHEVLAAAQEVDLPAEDPVTYEETVGRLRHPLPGMGEVRHWLARHDDEVVAVATLLLPENENAHVALPLLTVHPSRRRRGIGTAVLRALTPEMTSRGRTVVEGIQVGPVGEAWATALGFRTANATILQHLRFADADRSLWDVPPPAGYRVERWIGAAPDDLVASYVEAKNAITDSPRGDAAFQELTWTVDRVREAEAVAAERGVEQRVVVAVHERTGDVVGVTEVWVQPLRKPWVFQRDTAVLAAHRGHGLGVAIKARMLRWVTADRPNLVLAQTGTNADNVHMIAVNHALGFTTVRSMLEVNQPLDDLRQTLDRRRGK